MPFNIETNAYLQALLTHVLVTNLVTNHKFQNNNLHKVCNTSENLGTYFNFDFTAFEVYSCYKIKAIIGLELEGNY